MGIVRKERHLREIAALVGKGGFEFGADSRPSMDGGRVYIGSVYFDPDRGALDYTLCDRKGVCLVSGNGVRMLETLPEASLSGVLEAVKAGVSRRQSRQESQARIARAVRSKGHEVNRKI